MLAKIGSPFQSTDNPWSLIFCKMLAKSIANPNVMPEANLKMSYYNSETDHIFKILKRKNY